MPAFPGPTPKRFGVSARALALASALLAGPVVAATASVDVLREGDSYVVHASAPVAADPRVVWNTLTDYERLHEFLPDVEASRVIARDGNRLRVEYVGAFQVLFLAVPVRVRLAVEHEPMREVLARSEPGPVNGQDPTLRSFSGRYRLTPFTGPPTGTRVDYDARFTLEQALPGIVDSIFGRTIVAHGVRRQFEAMLDEIERRQALGSSAGGGR